MAESSVAEGAARALRFRAPVAPVTTHTRTQASPTARPLHIGRSMNHRDRKPFRYFIIAAIAAPLLAAPAVASADVAVTVEGPRAPRYDESLYPIEVEPHFTFGPENVYGAAGFGGGVRLGIPLVTGHLGSVPQNLALSFGGDILHHDNCFFGSDCGANYLMVPVAAQWNIFAVRRLSLFAEGGAFVYKGWFDGCRPGDGPGCSSPSDFGVLPTVAIGGRVHLGPGSALTLRVGYPTTTLGVSFL